MRDSARWAQFERLYEHVRSSLKKEFPDLQIGISFSLGHLRVETNAKAAKSLIAKSDYVGLSFYPSASPFDEKYGLPPYGSGADAWRKPLAWVRAYTDKPLALCETGYTTLNCDVPQFDLHIKGDPQLQAAYVRETLRDRQPRPLCLCDLVSCRRLRQALRADAARLRGDATVAQHRSAGRRVASQARLGHLAKGSCPKARGTDSPPQPRSAIKKKTDPTPENNGIEGTWLVVSVELAGQPLEGLRRGDTRHD